MARRWVDRNLSRLEIISVIIILMVLLNVFMNRVVNVFVSAEKTMVQNTLINMNSALRFHALYYVLKNDWESLQAMDRMNPVLVMTEAPGNDLATYADLTEGGKLKGLLIKPPANYVGEVARENAKQVPKGHWYFDKTTRRLVYHVRRSGLLGSNVVGKDRLEFMVNLEYEDLDRDGVFKAGTDRYRAIEVVAGEEYIWRTN